MFVDVARVSLKAGKGGDGAVSFRREIYIPKGGPDGGDGGKGGDIIFRADKNTDSLIDFRFTPILTAEDGCNGSGSRSAGRSGKDLVINVPVGTVVYKVSKLEPSETVRDNGSEIASEPRNDGRERSGPRTAHPGTRRLYPLEIHVDGKFYRYATCYVTIGMTAEACELFDEPKFRKEMQKGHKSSWRSYIALVKWYFKNRHKREFIPEFKLNGKLQHKKTSDYAAVSGRSMCRVMKGGDDYLDPKKFRSMTDRLTNFWRLFKLMVAAILVRTPGTETTGDTLEFIKPATVELQAEGEYQVFKNIKTIEIKKGAKCLKVIHN